MMAKLTEEYGVEVDPRFARCEKEAIFSLAIYLLAAVAGLGSMYGLTFGRSPDQYGAVLGLPVYLFWGIVVTDFGFLVALLVGQRFVFRDLSLEPVDPEYKAEGGPKGSRA